MSTLIMEPGFMSSTKRTMFSAMCGARTTWRGGRCAEGLTNVTSSRGRYYNPHL